MSDLQSPNKRPRNQYSLTDKPTFADVGPDNGGNDSCYRSHNYGTKAKPKSTLPAFKPLTITKHVDKPATITECHGSEEVARHNSSISQQREGVEGRGGLNRFRFQGGNGMIRGIRAQQSGGSGNNGEGSAGYQPQGLLPTSAQAYEEEYGGDVSYDEALMVGFVGANNSRGIQTEDTGEVEEGVSQCGQSNNASQGLDGGLYGQGDTQSKILVEEEGLHTWDGLRGDYIVLTPSQSNTTVPAEDYEKELPVVGNTPEPFSDNYFTPLEFASELQPDSPTGFVEIEDGSFVSPNIYRQPHLCTVEERFTTPSDVTLGYGDEIPEVFDPGLPGSPSSDGDKELPEHSGGLSGEEYDAFDDDELWKEIARKDFYIPPSSDPPSGDGDLVEEEILIQPTYAKEAIEPLDINLGPQKGKGVEPAPAEASVPALSRRRDKGKFKAPLPPTLVTPISHMSNPNPPQPLISPSAKRFLQNLDAGIPEPPDLAAESGNKATKWAHLPPEERQKPFVRPPLPEPVKERPSIEGLNTKTMMRVCFRIGEAIRFSNMDRSSSRGGESVTLTELFGLCFAYPLGKVGLDDCRANRGNSEGNVLGEDWHEAEYSIWYCTLLSRLPTLSLWLI
ncbi:hypothetical protein L211DRAFT_841264 [Terfezia boudieri ATCC MYA-4762]|uniref:Uncharacterized protein n=1 Tax=Terfezia boudieri ATCC MYA-4762 TaxID=1051890 RepID=A0A3N4LDI2_9PEZI|nr:hypothetical protein L211DRAFT_841264 [Terfezia boudieri ATCC MYA-4762]